MKKHLGFFLFLILKSFLYSSDEVTNEDNRRDRRLEEVRLQEEYIKREENWKEKQTSQEILFIVPEENSPRFFISRIYLQDEDKILDSLEKENLIGNYENKELGSLEISTLLHKITNHLIGKGYITSTVKVSENADLTTGILHLELVYGKVDKVILNENNNLDKLKKFFLVKQKEGNILNLRDLDTTTENFNYLEVNQMKMEIVPSEKENYSNVVLSNPMKEKFKLSLSTNNHGEDKQNGLWRYTTSLQIDSPLGIGDKIYFSYTSVHKKKPDRSWKSSTDIVEAGEILPIGPPNYEPSKGDVLPYKRILDMYNFQYTMKFRDYSLQLGKSRSEKESSFYAFNTIYDLKSVSDTFSLNLNKILWRNQKSKLSLGLGIKRKHNKNYLENAVLYDRILAIGDISLNGNTILWGGLLNTSLNYERGLRVLGAEKDYGKIATTPKAEFHKYSLNTSFYKPIDKFTYRFNLNATHSNDVLYGSEKQNIGGIGSVGGFHRTQNIQGDKAVEIENEFSYKIYEDEKFGTLSSYFIHSYGFVKNNENNTKYRKGHISGLMAGVRYEWKYLYFDFAYTKAINYSSYLEPRNREIYFSAGMKIRF